MAREQPDTSSAASRAAGRTWSRKGLCWQELSALANQDSELQLRLTKMLKSGSLPLRPSQLGDLHIHIPELACEPSCSGTLVHARRPHRLVA